ncbi:sensor histidine kinase [Streptomyces sp. NPDC018031]|uniref:sensor histidine kinase n=1 Tax=Streptomyces sp. NPDC018031 TaxID=3365033 RepID=UPI00379B8456
MSHRSVRRRAVLPGPLARAVTYTRWLHLLTGAVPAGICAFIYPGASGIDEPRALWLLVTPLPLLAGWAMLPVARLAEGLQARLLLTPGEHARRPGGDPAAGIAAAPATGWSERGLTALWLVLRLETGVLTVWLSSLLPATTAALLAAGTGGAPEPVLGFRLPGHHWLYGVLAPLPLVLLAVLVVTAGNLMAAAAPRLLGPSAAERLAALEERTERLLEHNRLARELHDSIGHALTVAVVQAGAARAAGSPEFTERALAAVEETGRRALEDLERVLLLLREGPGGRPADRPGLIEAERLLESARAAGTALTAEVSGEPARLPGPVSREGYRILQEALTNVLRHAGPVPVTVRMACAPHALELEVRNPLPAPAGTASGRDRGGRGLRGIRERAALLGGEAVCGPHGGQWRILVRLPLDGGARPAP